MGSGEARRVRSAVERAAAASGFALAPAQEVVLDRLLTLVGPLRSPARRRDLPGLYVWGPAGRGKSWLVGAFFTALADRLPRGAARRVHVYELFRDLHAAIHARGVVADAIDDVVRGARVLYLDELHLHDSGDATLLTRLLRQAFDAGVVVLATSNYAPGDLLPDPLWHHVAEPGIDLLRAHLDVAELDGPVDHRAPGDRGFAGGAWLTPGTTPQLVARALVTPAAGAAATVRTGTRTFAVTAVQDGTLWVTFADLAGRPTSTLEYLDWAVRFERWVVTDVPLLTDVDREAQQRFIAVVDVLCDVDVELVVTSAHDRDAFLAAMPDRPDAFRMASRITMLEPLGRTTALPRQDGPFARDVTG